MTKSLSAKAVSPFKKGEQKWKILHFVQNNEDDEKWISHIRSKWQARCVKIPSRYAPAPFNKGAQNIKLFKSQVKVKINKIYFKTSKTHQKWYRIVWILTIFVTKIKLCRNLNCKGRSLSKSIRTCLQMPKFIFPVGEDRGSSTCEKLANLGWSWWKWVSILSLISL